MSTRMIIIERSLVQFNPIDLLGPQRKTQVLISYWSADSELIMYLDLLQEE